jgi:acyl-CoA dehydrogenase
LSSDVALDADPAAAPFAPRHAALRASVRAFVEGTLRPYADEWEAARSFPRSVFSSAGEAGLLGWKYGAADGGLGPDPLADVVVTEELARCGSGGVAAGLGATKDLAPYYVYRFGTDDQRARWLRPCVSGAAVAGLAVTEPGAGSDVAALATRAERDGDGWEVFCTNGSRADWILVAARTSPPSDGGGAHGISLFVVPADTPGFTASRIPTLGWRTSQTGALSFSSVSLPGDALLGGVGDGFVMIMKSFQWERLALAFGSLSASAANLAACRTSSAAWRSLALRLAAVRALAYDALTRHLAGEEPLRQVSAAKWLACDLDVETALMRYETTGTPAAERALRDARLGPIGGGAREVMAELVARTLF